MKFRKFIVLFFLFVFSISGVLADNTCQPAYRNVRKISKNKKMQSKRSKAYKKRTKAKSRGARPINTSYVVRTKRKTTFHY